LVLELALELEEPRVGCESFYAQPVPLKEEIPRQESGRERL
jgi:hypothetical protein